MSKKITVALVVAVLLALALTLSASAQEPVTISTVLDKVFFVTDAAGNLVEVPPGTSATITIWGDGTATLTWSGGSGRFPSHLVGWGVEQGTFGAPAGDAYLPAGAIRHGVEVVSIYSGMQVDRECWDNPHSDFCRGYWERKNAGSADVARPGVFGQTYINGFPLRAVPLPTGNRRWRQAP